MNKYYYLEVREIENLGPIYKQYWSNDIDYVLSHAEQYNDRSKYIWSIYEEEADN